MSAVGRKGGFICRLFSVIAKCFVEIKTFKNSGRPSLLTSPKLTKNYLLLR